MQNLSPAIAMASPRTFFEDESGATAIEYGLIVGLIALVMIVALTATFNNVSGKFNRISSALNGAG